ncbi:MAG: adenylate/guanylate cyclase domain-containing protein [Candidatus Promineifilaceae bacterium]
MPVSQSWPGGVVTFLFSDIEDSTPLWDQHRGAMRTALAVHDEILQTAVSSNGGLIVKTTGDGAMAAFVSPSAALAAALDAQRALRDAAWETIAPDRIRARMGLHTGEAELRAVAVEIDRPQGEESAREAYEIGRAQGYRDIQNLALNAMARWALTGGDIQAAAAYLAEARQIRTGLAMPILIMAQAYVESMVARATGDLEGALRVLNEGVEALRLSRHRHFANVLDSEMAHTLRQSGDLASALEIYRRTIILWQDVGRRGAVANQLECFAFIATAAGQLDRAARLFGAAKALRETLDQKMMPEEKKEYDAYVSDLREMMDSGALAEAWQAGRGMDLDTAVAYALEEADEHEG